MALTIKKTSTLNGESKVNGELIVTMSAEFSSETTGSSFNRQSIVNQDAYAKNVIECRNDLKEFQAKVYEIQDKFIEEGFLPI